MNKPPQPDGFRPVRPGGRGGKARAFSKGRQVDVQALDEIDRLMAGRELRRDLLIEYLHLVQDNYGHISAGILRRSPMHAPAAWPRSMRLQPSIIISTW